MAYKNNFKPILFNKTDVFNFNHQLKYQIKGLGKVKIINHLSTKRGGVAK